MLPLLLAFLLILLAFHRLLRRGPSTPLSSPSSAAERPAAHTKLLDEAFAHTSSSSSSSSTPFIPVLVLYASEYGFANQVALHLSKLLSTSPSSQDPAQLRARVLNVLHYRLLDFTRELFVILVCSTTGDGVPPNEATAFRDALVATDVILPSSTRFAVLALGDRAYPHFCRAGAIFDQLLPSSCRLLPRTDVDQEDWSLINSWSQHLQQAILSHIHQNPIVPVSHDYLHNAIDKYAESLSNVDAQYTLNNPLSARMSARRRLTAPAVKPGHKEVIRVHFDIADSALSYQVGDALAVVPNNNPEHVNMLLRTLAANGDEMVKLSDNAPMRQFEHVLLDALDINIVRPQFVTFLARHCASANEVNLAIKILGVDPRDPAVVKQAVTPSPFGKAYLAERNVNDVLQDFGTAALVPQQVVNHLRPLHARYYSISSSPITSPDSVAVTVDVLRYETISLKREGVASTFLQDRCRVGETMVDVFLSKNPNFRLPNDTAKPIIMVGPGTGIAPFIAFLEERDATNATGENWLFFGCRFEKQDFLYQEELRKYAGRGFLRLRTAFSRDHPEKEYVQKRMRECSSRLWELINSDGAHVYVCGDGGKMAVDVDETLRTIIASEGGMTSDDAKVYLEDLSEKRRYQRDVWVS